MTDSAHQAMAEILADELATARLLLDSLHAERDALAANRVEQLETLAEQKQGLAERLESLARRRRSALLESGVGDSFDAWVKAQHALQRNWSAIIDILENCQQLNRTNGRVVDQLQRRTRNTLALLQGQSGIQELYGPGGKTESSSGSQILSRA